MIHITIRNEKLFCTKCGGEFKMNYPIKVDDFQKKSDAFIELHKDCEQTWTEPVADLSQDIIKRAEWWLKNGETGLSSMTMWSFFMGNKSFGISYPHDPDDFKRCYKLLEAVPEWKERILEIKVLCPEWSNLADNWDTLTKMYEQNVEEKWENHEKIGMYQLMNKLTRLK